MAKVGKSLRTPSNRVDRVKKYSLKDAFELLPKTKISSKFDETVDLAVRLGVDPKHADQMVRGAVVLPHGTGKVFASSCSPGRQGERGTGGGR